MNTEAPAGTPPETVWFKSSYSSGAGGECLEVAAQPHAILVRDSKHLIGPVLSLDPGSWSAFVAYAVGA
ncbi:DUF397 domain-containing protein [Streptomyces halstedii]|uniref:DUF397 domain-containing protein n=1 Tax=Streptomyces halstedii TaxID=1944 RepID=UPI003809B47B